MSRKVSYSYIEKIVYSPQFRNMQDKTQLFYSAPKRQVRTRLTHTMEVKVIACRIGSEINKALDQKLIDLDLVDAIALAHDIGHTPFGHVGERTINSILSGKDDLGGLIPKAGRSKMRFKHNVNSYRILNQLGVDDWRILEGALCHTKIFYKDSESFRKNPYDPFREVQNNREKFIQQNHDIFTQGKHSAKYPSLTLEGQIVAIADEIAQRVADVSDGLESRRFEHIKEILGIVSKVSTRANLEMRIRENLIDDVISNTLLNLKSVKPVELEQNGILHNAYAAEVVCFSEDKAKQNKELEDFITVMMAQSEDVRESDSRSRYIIRQLFKAYLKDVSLLPDDIIDEYFCKIINKETFKASLAKMPEGKERKTFVAIKKQLWRYTGTMSDKKQDQQKDQKKAGKNKLVIDLGKVRDFFEILNENERAGVIPEMYDLFDEYILRIGFYIAGMTNTEAFTAYNRIYGHS